MATDGYADQNTKRVDGIFFFVVCGCMFRSVGIWEIGSPRRIVASRCAAFINQPSCISSHHTRSIHFYSYSYIFPTTQRIISHQTTITAKMQYKSLAVLALSAGALAAPEKRQATDANL
jgi:hypothetical protein